MADYTIKQVGAMLVAGIRFRGQFADVPAAFRRLHEQAASCVSGSAMCFYHGCSMEGEHDLEVCYPVSQPVEAGEIVSRQFNACDMVAFLHEGSRDSAEAIYGSAADSINERLPNQPPYAIVYLEEGDEFRESTAQLMTELWVPPWSPYWLAQLGEGVGVFSGEAIRQRVMAGVENITLDTPPGERAAWIVGALERLEAEVPDEDTRSQIMRGCSHRFPRWRIEQMRIEYEQLGSIDALLAIMHLDRSVDGQGWYGQQIRVGNIIYTTKDPADQEGYKKAETDLDRRAAYCFCGLVKGHMQSGGEVPFTHCYCGAGWFHQLWGGILGKPVKVEIVTSVLQGDDVCLFAVHLPDEI